MLMTLIHAIPCVPHADLINGKIIRQMLSNTIKLDTVQAALRLNQCLLNMKNFLEQGPQAVKIEGGKHCKGHLHKVT